MERLSNKFAEKQSRPLISCFFHLLVKWVPCKTEKKQVTVNKRKTRKKPALVGKVIQFPPVP